MLIQVTTVTITTTAASPISLRRRNFTIETPSRRAKLTAPVRGLERSPTRGCAGSPRVTRGKFPHGPGGVLYGRAMKRALPLAVVAGLAVAATALAAQGDNPYASPEPAVTAGQLLRLPGSAPGCGSVRKAKVRITPPTGAILGFVRIVVDGREAARLTGVPRAASATVRIPQSGGRLTVSAETLGGQRLRASRVYSDCTRPPDTGSGGGGGGGQVGGGGEG